MGRDHEIKSSNAETYCSGNCPLNLTKLDLGTKLGVSHLECQMGGSSMSPSSESRVASEAGTWPARMRRPRLLAGQIPDVASSSWKTGELVLREVFTLV